MKNRNGLLAGLFILGASVAGMMGCTAAAEEYYYDDGYYEEYYYDDYSDGYYEEEYYEEERVLDGDNSLYELGLNKEYKCSPDFVYNVLEYNVTVPAGTKKFDFEPVKSSGKAEITEIKGTDLDANGSGTVEVTVVAENSAKVTYYLYVTSDGAKAEAEAATTKKKNNKNKKKAAETEAQTEKETESSADKAKEIENITKNEKLALEAAESEKLLLQSENDALTQKVAQLEQKEGQVSLLQGENDDLAYRLDLLMKVLYGLIGFGVLLLMFIINQSLRNKDLKDDIKRTKAELEDAMSAPATTDAYYAPVFTPAEEVPLSKKEQKRLAKETKKAAKIEAKQAKAAKAAEAKAETPAPVPVPAPAPVVEAVPEPAAGEVKGVETETEAPVQPENNGPQLVKGSVNEPDVKVNMIDL